MNRVRLSPDRSGNVLWILLAAVAAWAILFVAAAAVHGVALSMVGGVS